MKDKINLKICATTQDLPTQTMNGKIVFIIATVKIIVVTMVKRINPTRKKLIILEASDLHVQQEHINATLCPHCHQKSNLNRTPAQSKLLPNR